MCMLLLCMLLTGLTPPNRGYACACSGVRPSSLPAGPPHLQQGTPQWYGIHAAARVLVPASNDETSLQLVLVVVCELHRQVCCCVHVDWAVFLCLMLCDPVLHIGRHGLCVAG